MILYLLSLLFFFSQLFANEEGSIAAVTAGEPSSFVADCVSAITGAFFISDEDILIQGVEPRLKFFTTRSLRSLECTEATEREIL